MMEMTLRWFGPGYDTVPLAYIRQIPGVTGVVSTLYGAAPGQAWEASEIGALKRCVEDAGLKLVGIESVNIHDSIKVGAPDRDQYIENYITTLKRLGQAGGIRCVCYNFMPVFDWTRSDLARVLPDGATTMAYDQKIIDGIDADHIFSAMQEKAGGHLLPGWEPERLEKLAALFDLYAPVTQDMLFDHLAYFLRAIEPVCTRYEIGMAIHPDDPPWPVFGLGRIMTGRDNLLRLMRLVDKPFNGVTLCTGSLGADRNTDLPELVHALRGRIHFAHLRNLRHFGPGDFEEAPHRCPQGSVDLIGVVRALKETGFDGLIRPDHGRMIWGETGLPGYGLYDRALGAQYLLGLWDAL